MTSSSTRISRSEVLDLCETIHASGPLPVFGARVLGLFLCVRLTLTYLRHNLPQELLAELYRVSQATTSRVIGAYTPLIAQALQASVPTVEDLDPTARLIVDGTLLECWSWVGHPELCSGKHRTTGLNVQVACTLSGALAWVSGPQDGRTHDTEVLRRCGLLDVPATDLPDGTPPRHVGDKGYIGLGMITPRRKPANLPLHPDDKTYNTTVNQIRYKIERVIANTQDLEGPSHRLQKTTRHLPGNHHSHPRNHIHLHPMNKPRGVGSIRHVRVPEAYSQGETSGP